MKLLDSQSDETSLAQLGADVLRLIVERNCRDLAARFGYALAYGKEPAEVIEAEIAACLSKHANATLRRSNQANVAVKYFAPNDANLFASVECALALGDDAGALLAELVVTTMGCDKHVFLEQIRYAA